MRYTSINCVTKGMIVNKPILDLNGNLLLNERTKLTDNHINRIKKLNMKGIYVDSYLSNEIKEKIENDIKSLAKISLPIVSNSKDLSLIFKTIDSILCRKSILANLVDLKYYDEHLYIQSINVLLYGLLMGSALKLKPLEMYELGVSALLHKFEKPFTNYVDIEILESNSSIIYTKEKVKCLSSNIPHNSLKGILDHQVRHDSRNISKYAKIIAICNIYHCLLENYSPSDSLEYIMANSGSLFDIGFVKIFCSTINLYPKGTKVLLNNNKKGIIINNTAGFPSRPCIEIDDVIIDLSNSNFNVTIKDIDN